MSSPVDRPVPFVSNAPNDMMCFEAAVGMVLAFFEEAAPLSFSELMKITGKSSDISATWPLSTCIYFNSIGLDVQCITPFDYQEFSKSGLKYIRDTLGDEVADYEAANSSIALEQSRVAEFLESGVAVQRIPTSEDLLTAINQGLAIALINSRILLGQDGYAGHAVVVKGGSPSEVILHDPGLPALADKRVSMSVFEQAWSRAGDVSKVLITIADSRRL